MICGLCRWYVFYRKAFLFSLYLYACSLGDIQHFSLYSVSALSTVVSLYLIDMDVLKISWELCIYLCELSRTTLSNRQMCNRLFTQYMQLIHQLLYFNQLCMTSCLVKNCKHCRVFVSFIKLSISFDSLWPMQTNSLTPRCFQYLKPHSSFNVLVNS